MLLPFDQFHAFLSTATKVLVFICLASLGTAFGFALLGFPEVVANVQKLTRMSAIACVAALGLLAIAWISGAIARRIERPESARSQ